LRQKETSASHAEREVIRLQERLAKLEVTLEITTNEREEIVRKVKIESRSYKSFLDEFERSRDEVHRYKDALKDLNEELDQRQNESLKASEKIFHMESTLRAYKKETKERVNTLVDREKDYTSVLERTRHKNRDMTSNLRNLSDMVERLRRERDICFLSLQDGQKKLSELSSKNSMVQLDDLLTTPLNQRRSPRHREPRTAPRSSYPPVESITARALARVVPEIYVSNYHLGVLGSPTTLAEERAEEIAACVAQNAKNSLEENFEEVSQLRSQIFRLEDDRSEQVSALKTKVRSLEKELTDERVGNRTPVMGSSARRTRKQNYFVDWDEKHAY